MSLYYSLLPLLALRAFTKFLLRIPPTSFSCSSKLKVPTNSFHEPDQRAWAMVRMASRLIRDARQSGIPPTIAAGRPHRNIVMEFNGFRSITDRNLPNALSLSGAHLQWKPRERDRGSETEELRSRKWDRENRRMGIQIFNYNQSN